jgi:hypothetical protein
MNPVKEVMLFVFVVLSMVPGTGCTLIGFTAGCLYDEHASGGPQSNEMKLIGTFEPGQALIVYQKNGDTVAGTYCGMPEVAAEDYASVFAPFAHSMEGGTFPPALGEPIKLITNQEGVTKVTKGKFAGFDLTYLFLQTASATQREQIPVGIISTIVDTSRNVIQGMWFDPL